MMAKSQRGMTLLETLIALVILAGAMTAALAIARTAERLNSAALRRQQYVDNAFGGSYLRALLEGAAPVVRETASGSPILDFSGGPQEISFHSTFFAEAERPRFEQARLSIVEGAVLLSRGAKADGEQTPRVLMVLDGPARFRYGATSAEGRLHFVDDWSNRSTLPDAIVVEKSVDAESATHVALVAAPMLSSSF